MSSGRAGLTPSRPLVGTSFGTPFGTSFDTPFGTPFAPFPLDRSEGPQGGSKTGAGARKMNTLEKCSLRGLSSDMDRPSPSNEGRGDER